MAQTSAISRADSTLGLLVRFGNSKPLEIMTMEQAQSFIDSPTLSHSASTLIRSMVESRKGLRERSEKQKN